MERSWNYDFPLTLYPISAGSRKLIRKDGLIFAYTVVADYFLAPYATNNMTADTVSSIHCFSHNPNVTVVEYYRALWTKVLSCGPVDNKESFKVGFTLRFQPVHRSSLLMYRGTSRSVSFAALARHYSFPSRLYVAMTYTKDVDHQRLPNSSCRNHRKNRFLLDVHSEEAILKRTLLESSHHGAVGPAIAVRLRNRSVFHPIEATPAWRRKRLWKLLVPAHLVCLSSDHTSEKWQLVQDATNIQTEHIQNLRAHRQSRLSAWRISSGLGLSTHLTNISQFGGEAEESCRIRLKPHTKIPSRRTGWENTIWPRLLS